jgi:hypothetical protein
MQKNGGFPAGLEMRAVAFRNTCPRGAMALLTHENAWCRIIISLTFQGQGVNLLAVGFSHTAT